MPNGGFWRGKALEDMTAHELREAHAAVMANLAKEEAWRQERAQMFPMIALPASYATHLRHAAATLEDELKRF